MAEPKGLGESPFRELGRKLEATRVPARDIKIIIGNLEKFNLTHRDFGTVSENLLKDARFREKFMKDPKAAIEYVGANPTPHPREV